MVDPATPLYPSSVPAARALLVELGAPARLLRHVELVGEAAELLLTKLVELGVPVRGELVRVGAVLHDVGKVIHVRELEGAGAAHEPAGERLLRERGVSPEIARICVSHASWEGPAISLEELLVALADKLWKGVRVPPLEDRVVEGVAARAGTDRWAVFTELDDRFEEIAAGGPDRLERSRV